MQKFTTTSDIGSVLFGTDDFRIALPNGYGDGVSYVTICKKGEIDIDPRYFFTSISGSFNIYNDDCSDGDKKDIVVSLQGRYGVYSYDRQVILERWE